MDCTLVLPKSTVEPPSGIAVSRHLNGMGRTAFDCARHGVGAARSRPSHVTAEAPSNHLFHAATLVESKGISIYIIQSSWPALSGQVGHRCGALTGQFLPRALRAGGGGPTSSGSTLGSSLPQAVPLELPPPWRSPEDRPHDGGLCPALLLVQPWGFPVHR